MAPIIVKFRLACPRESATRDYQVLRMNEAPAIEVYIVASAQPPGGMGEAGTSAIAPAVTNAIYAAAGTRVRKLPVGDQAKRA